MNGYWSPLYPALIGSGVAVANPSADELYPLVRLIGFGVYVLAVLAYARLTERAVARLSAASHASALAVALGRAVAWLLFFLLVTQAIGLHLATPDMGVAAIVFWVAAELLDLDASPWLLGRWTRFGAVLAVGYWWKAILFPVAGVAILVAWWLAWRRRDPRRPPVAAAVAFGALALVVAVPVSVRVGRPTFGETGRLNHLWYVSHAPMIPMLCIPPEGQPNITAPWKVEPERVILRQPLTCATRDAVPEATLPQWYDPSPWYARAANRFRAGETLAAARNNVVFIRTEVAAILPFAGIALVVGMFAAAVVSLRRQATGRALAPIALFASVPVVAYASVYVELRHIVPFLLCIALWAIVTLLHDGGRVARAAVALLILGAATDTVRRLASQQRVEAAITVHEWRGAPRPEQQTKLVAEALLARGLHAGDRVATVNTFWNVEWAQRAGLVVRAYVPEHVYPIFTTFADLADPCRHAAFTDALRAEGITATVLVEVPGTPPPAGFEALGDTGYWLQLVPPASAPPPSCGAGAIRSSSGTGAR